MLKELVDRLTCRELDPQGLASCVAALEGAAHDPELDWLDDPTPQELLQTALVFKLAEFTAVGDKIDEVHEQISDFFAEPLPEYPLHADGGWFLPDEYFVWLDQRLIERHQAQRAAGQIEQGQNEQGQNEHSHSDESPAQGGGYELLLLGEHFSDNLHAIVVLRADTSRVLEIATALALTIERATERRLA